MFLTALPRPMEIQNTVAIIVFFFLAVVPVLGFSARFLLKPIVESLLTLRDAIADPGLGSPDGEARLLELEEEVRELRRSLDRLADSRDWEQALLEGRDPSSRPQARTFGRQPLPTGREWETGTEGDPGPGP